MKNLIQEGRAIQEKFSRTTLNEHSAAHVKFMTAVFNDLDKNKFERLSFDTVYDYNKVAKYLKSRIPNVPQSFCMAVANVYGDYIKGLQYDGIQAIAIKAALDATKVLQK